VSKKIGIFPKCKGFYHHLGLKLSNLRVGLSEFKSDSGRRDPEGVSRIHLGKQNKSKLE